MYLESPRNPNLTSVLDFVMFISCLKQVGNTGKWWSTVGLSRNDSGNIQTRAAVSLEGKETEEEKGETKSFIPVILRLYGG